MVPGGAGGRYLGVRAGGGGLTHRPRRPLSARESGLKRSLRPFRHVLPGWLFTRDRMFKWKLLPLYSPVTPAIGAERVRDQEDRRNGTPHRAATLNQVMIRLYCFSRHKDIGIIFQAYPTDRRPPRTVPGPGWDCPEPPASADQDQESRARSGTRIHHSFSRREFPGLFLLVPGKSLPTGLPCPEKAGDSPASPSWTPGNLPQGGFPGIQRPSFTLYEIM